MKQINLNALRVFAMVARHGNLQRAADVLNLSRGAVSQRIKQLELDLGVVLFLRGAQGVSLTPEGERCRAATDDALALLETAFVDIGAVNDRVTLHLGSSTASKWLMPRMDGLTTEFPKLSLTTQVHEQPLQRSLGRNEIAIWPGTTPDTNPTHQCRQLTDIRLVAVCSPDFPRSDRPMGLETLLTLPLLQDAHRRWEKLIQATGYGDTHKLLNFDRSALAIEAAIGGHGIAVAPTYMVEADIQSKRLVDVWIDPEPSEERLFISWSREHVGGRPIRRIVDWITDEFAASPPIR
ncbi:transcriptional regulator [Roseobacter cerasinus]|uniref:Transcriptional regulator n=1 Tax=Roseobacter cerasinus TaxID=2602289 RepID=A0A640VPQ1_9RHOB|nr:LysR family transcriptional regulator [Roseobacter cerasinus]GFE49594.1 transcriptional regulator [Roseobacter cerasinus]